ncbi:MAG TPA: HDOD domain-containing protein [Fibrobacteraceae bacterium]|nr:HDOD domain-containing protein [Fibrobacteraceae bacterium]
MTEAELQEEIGRLQPFPVSLMRLTDIILSSHYSVDDVFHVVQHDPTLTLDVLAYANSAESAAARSITSVQEAIIRLGGPRIMRILVAKWFHGTMNATLKAEADSTRYWLRGTSAALAADVLQEQGAVPQQPAAFTTALLRDVGLLPLYSYACAHHSVWLTSKKDEEQEVETFGFTHGEVSAKILAQWKFPLEMVQAVATYSQATGGPSPLTDTLRLAELVCTRITTPGWTLTPAKSDLLSRNEISAAQWENLIQHTHAKVARVSQEFSISLPPFSQE